MKYTIDSSVAVECLLRTPLGIKVSGIIEEAELVAPELLDVEVLSVLRRAVRQSRLDEQRALLALEDLVDWPVDRISHSRLIADAWRVRHNVSAYDAFYVAAAFAFDAPLLTADGPLSRAPKVGIAIHNVRM